MNLASSREGPFFTKVTEQRVHEGKSLDGSRVAFIIAPGRHPRLLFNRVQLESVFVLWSFLLDPHSVVTGDAVVLQGAREEATLQRVEI